MVTHDGLEDLRWKFRSDSVVLIWTDRLEKKIVNGEAKAKPFAFTVTEINERAESSIPAYSGYAWWSSHVYMQY